MIQRMLQRLYLLPRFLLQPSHHLFSLRTSHHTDLCLRLRHNSLMQLLQNILLLYLISQFLHLLCMCLLSSSDLSLEFPQCWLFDLANTHTQLAFQLCLVLLNLPLVLMLQLWDLLLVLVLTADFAFAHSLQPGFLSWVLEMKFL